MNYKHGMKWTKLYTTWRSMRSRCENPNEPAFPNYGGRGITVCDRWKTFPNFYADMGDRPPGLLLDRIDNDKGYGPDNCRWSTRKEQNNNKRDNILITINGKTQSLKAWSEVFGIPYKTAHMRIRNGWPPEIAATHPLVRDRKGLTRKGAKAYAFAAERGVTFRDQEAA